MEEPGLNGKAAKDCTPEEIKAEVWEQIKRSLNYGDVVMLKDEHLHSFSLDPSLSRHRAATANEEPLLVNLVDTWKLRPEAVSKIPNLFLASDYVRTFTDLATMEAANEAARRAVNGILDAAGSECRPLRRLAPARARDLRAVARARLHPLLTRTALGRHARAHRALVLRAGRQGDLRPSRAAPRSTRCRSARRRLPPPYQALAIVRRPPDAGRALTSDLRRDATSLDRAAGSAAGASPGRGAGRGSAGGSGAIPGAGTIPGRVEIVPK